MSSPGLTLPPSVDVVGVIVETWCEPVCRLRPVTPGVATTTGQALEGGLSVFSSLETTPPSGWSSFDCSSSLMLGHVFLLSCRLYDSLFFTPLNISSASLFPSVCLSPLPLCFFHTVFLSSVRLRELPLSRCVFLWPSAVSFFSSNSYQLYTLSHPNMPSQNGWVISSQF